MPMPAMRRQAEILSRCAAISHRMAMRSCEDDRALRIREAAALLEEVAAAMRAGERRAPPSQPPARRLRAI